MIPIRQKIQRSGTGFSRAEWNAILKLGWERAGKVHHREVTPKHFTVAGGHEYNYQKRSKLYMLRKAKKMGHQRPLVWSGASERAAMRIRDVRASSKAARIGYHMPAYFYKYSKHVGDPRKAFELATVSEKDAQTAARVIDKTIQIEANKSGRTVDVTRGHRVGVG